MWNFSKRKNRTEKVDMKEENPFIFIAQTVEKKILADLFFAPWRKRIATRRLKPQFDIFFAEQAETGSFSEFYTLMSNYSTGKESLNVALRKISVSLLQHGAGIGQQYIIMHPELNLIFLTSSIITEIWKYLNDQLNTPWFHHEAFTI